MCVCVCGWVGQWLGTPPKKNQQYPLLQEPGKKSENHFLELIFQLFFFPQFTTFPIQKLNSIWEGGANNKDLDSLFKA